MISPQPTERTVRRLRRLCILLLAMVLLCGGVFAVESSPEANAATIKSLETEYTIAQDGSCTVLLRADMTFSAGVSKFSLPVPGEAKHLSVSAPNYSTSREGGALLVTLSAPSGLRDQTVSLSYTLPETVTANDERQLCTLKLLLPERACAIEKYSTKITLPAEFEEMPQFESGYYGDLIENYLDIEISKGVIQVGSRQAFRDHEALTMTLELPVGYFDLRFLAGKTAQIDVIAFWALLGAGLVWWLVFVRNRLFLPKSVAMPPLAGNAGAVPYLLGGSRADLAGMVMHWASLGYLTVTRTRRGSVYLEKQIDMGAERKSYEVQIFRSLFERREGYTAPCDDYRMVRERTPLLTRAFWESRIFVPHRGFPIVLRLLGAGCGAALTLLSYDKLMPTQFWRWFAIAPLALLGGLSCWLLQPVSSCFLRRRPERTLLLGLGGLLFLVLSLQPAKLGLLTAVCVLFQLLIGWILFLGDRRSKSGMRWASELLGLRRYLRRSKPEELQKNLSEDPQYFYRTLPYAEALCTGGSFVQKLRDAELEPCDWLQSERKTPQNAEEFAQLYRAVLDTLREQTDAPLWNLLRNLIRRKTQKRARS